MSIESVLSAHVRPAILLPAALAAVDGGASRLYVSRPGGCRAQPIAEDRPHLSGNPDHTERLTSQQQAKQALLAKFRQAATDPGIAERAAARSAVIAAREVREAEKQKRLAAEAAERARLAELERIAQAEAAALAAAEAAAREQEEAEAALALLAQQKAARDARYAARKAAKKQRRKGT